MADTQVHASIPTAADGTYAAMFDAVVKRYPESRALIFPGGPGSCERWAWARETPSG
jgi:hypothetical protein